MRFAPNPCGRPAPTGRWLAVPDRGLDRIFVLRLDTANGALSRNDPGWVPTRELAGPRHIAFNPTAPFAYAIDELRSTITTYRWDNKRGTLEALQVLPSTPPDMTGDCRAAETSSRPPAATSTPPIAAAPASSIHNTPRTPSVSGRSTPTLACSNP